MQEAYKLDMSLDQIIEKSSSTNHRGRGRFDRFGGQGRGDYREHTRSVDRGPGGRNLRVAVPIDMKQRGTPRG